MADDQLVSLEESSTPATPEEGVLPLPEEGEVMADDQLVSLEESSTPATPEEGVLPLPEEGDQAGPESREPEYWTHPNTYVGGIWGKKQDRSSEQPADNSTVERFSTKELLRQHETEDDFSLHFNHNLPDICAAIDDTYIEIHSSVLRKRAKKLSELLNLEKWICHAQVAGRHYQMSCAVLYKFLQLGKSAIVSFTMKSLWDSCYFIYNGTLPYDIDLGRAEVMLVVSRSWELDDLQSVVKDFLIRQLTPSTSLTIYCCAVKHDFPSLRNEIVTIMQENSFREQLVINFVNEPVPTEMAARLLKEIGSSLDVVQGLIDRIHFLRDTDIINNFSALKRAVDMLKVLKISILREPAERKGLTDETKENKDCTRAFLSARKITKEGKKQGDVFEEKILKNTRHTDTNGRIAGSIILRSILPEGYIKKESQVDEKEPPESTKQISLKTNGEAQTHTSFGKKIGTAKQPSSRSTDFVTEITERICIFKDERFANQSRLMTKFIRYTESVDGCKRKTVRGIRISKLKEATGRDTTHETVVGIPTTRIIPKGVKRGRRNTTKRAGRTTPRRGRKTAKAKVVWPYVDKRHTEVKNSVSKPVTLIGEKLPSGGDHSTVPDTSGLKTSQILRRLTTVTEERSLFDRATGLTVKRGSKFRINKARSMILLKRKTSCEGTTRGASGTVTKTSATRDGTIIIRRSGRVVTGGSAMGGMLNGEEKGQGMEKSGGNFPVRDGELVRQGKIQKFPEERNDE